MHAIPSKRKPSLSFPIPPSLKYTVSMRGKTHPPIIGKKPCDLRDATLARLIEEKRKMQSKGIVIQAMAALDLAQRR
jgi:hypothetical protein